MSALSRTGTFFCLFLFFSFEFFARFTALSINTSRCLRVIGLSGRIELRKASGIPLLSAVCT